MPLTVTQARKLFGRYVPEGISFLEALNQVQERLLPAGAFKGTRSEAKRMIVYEDRYGNQTITLPPDYETVLAGAYAATDPNSVVQGSFWCGRPLPIRNEWYSTAPNGPGNQIGSDVLRGIIRLNGRFTTFGDWLDEDNGTRLRIKLEKDESPGGTIIFRGFSGGAKIFTTSGDRQMEGVGLAYTSGTATTTQTFDEPPYQIIKPITKGRVKLYTVDADDNETIVGWYEPSETNPSYARFKVPVCPSTSST